MHETLCIIRCKHPQLTLIDPGPPAVSPGLWLPGLSPHWEAAELRAEARRAALEVP